MAAEVKKLEPAPAKPPDMSKPVAIQYWKISDTLGTLVDRMVSVGGYVNDGRTQGRVREIWFFPDGGYAVAILEVGFRPNVVDKDQEIKLEKLILTNGHGRES